VNDHRRRIENDRRNDRLPLIVDVYEPWANDWAGAWGSGVIVGVTLLLRGDQPAGAEEPLSFEPESIRLRRPLPPSEAAVEAVETAERIGELVDRVQVATTRDDAVDLVVTFLEQLIDRAKGWA
jgi:hypothetical protein